MTDLTALPLQRYVIKIGGESGQGINSVGEILAKSFKEIGYQVFGYREYPSLIKGGYSCYQVDISDVPLNSASSHCDLLVCISRLSLHAYLRTLRPGGQLIHTLKAFRFNEDEEAWIKENQIAVEYIDADSIAVAAGGKTIMANTVMIGVLLQVLDLNEKVVTRILEEEFASKPQVLDANKACITQGMSYALTVIKKPALGFAKDQSLDNAYLVSGNHALALGAISAGVRAYYAYPMTPSSSILSYLSSWYHQTGMLVRQVEDEISVAEMTLGSMFMGTRALCGTSGGGFDLMTETVSLAGMTETPFVCILGQRPGPATGLPTWTAAADLNLAIYAGHGEYPRCVIAVSDIESGYVLVQKAFTLAEKYQIPVILMTEKQIAESLFLWNKIPDALPIERFLVPDGELATLKSENRYEVTESGISRRWLPGQSPAVFDANSDEHTPDGTLTEEAEPSRQMYEKRLRKHDVLLKELPEPVLYGEADAQFIMVGWGSTKNTVLDVQAWLEKNNAPFKIAYLHYEYLFPLRTEVITKLFTDHQDQLVLVENNYLGQLGRLITQETGFKFKKSLLKYDGRPFFFEDIRDYINQQLGVSSK